MFLNGNLHFSVQDKIQFMEHSKSESSQTEMKKAGLGLAIIVNILIFQEAYINPEIYNYLWISIPAIALLK